MLLNFVVEYDLPRSTIWNWEKCIKHMPARSIDENTVAAL